MAKQSVTISFSTKTSDDDIDLVVDMDDEKNNDEANGGSGRTSSFIFGDEAFFRVFTNPITNVDVSCYASDGVLKSYGQSYVENEQYLEFNEPYVAQGGEIEENVASLSFPVFSNFAATAFSANTCGSVTLNPEDPTEALASAAGPGVYKATYKSIYWSFSIKKASIPTNWPSDTAYPIVIVIVGLES